MSDKNLRSEYVGRINDVFHFIGENLDADLSLAWVSEVACFSPFHFHRIFKIITGETLNEYIIRRRLERAASYLIHRKNLSISEIWMQTGFNSDSAFSRSFKKFYGVSPTDFRREHQGKFSKIGQVQSKNGQEISDHVQYICNITNLKDWTRMNAKIEIEQMPDLTVAYVTSIGVSNLSGAFATLVKWAEPRGLMTGTAPKMLTIYHDSFKITPPEKVRISAGIVLQEEIEVGGEIGLTFIEAGKFIKGSFNISPAEFEKSWSGLFIWMNENGYRMTKRNPFEIFHNDYRKHPEGKCIVDFYIPIES